MSQIARFRSESLSRTTTFYNGDGQPMRLQSCAPCTQRLHTETNARIQHLVQSPWFREVFEKDLFQAEETQTQARVILESSPLQGSRVIVITSDGRQLTAEVGEGGNLENRDVNAYLSETIKTVGNIYADCMQNHGSRSIYRDDRSIDPHFSTRDDTTRYMDPSRRDDPLTRTGLDEPIARRTDLVEPIRLVDDLLSDDLLSCASSSDDPERDRSPRYQRHSRRGPPSVTREELEMLHRIEALRREEAELRIRTQDQRIRALEEEMALKEQIQNRRLQNLELELAALRATLSQRHGAGFPFSETDQTLAHRITTIQQELDFSRRRAPHRNIRTPEQAVEAFRGPDSTTLDNLTRNIEGIERTLHNAREEGADLLEIIATQEQIIEELRRAQQVRIENNHQLNQRIESLSNQLTRTYEEINRLNSSLEQARGENHSPEPETDPDNRDLEREITRSLTISEEIQAELDELIRAKDESETELMRTREQLAASKEALTLMQERLQTAESTANTERNERQRYQTLLDHTLIHSTHFYNAFEARLQGESELIDTLLGQRDAFHATRADELVSRNATLSQSVAALEGQLHNSREENATISAQKERAERASGLAQAGLEAAANERTAMQEEINQLRQDIQATTNKRLEISAQLVTLERRSIEQGSQIDELQGKNRHLTTQNTDLQEQISQANAEIEHLTNLLGEQQEALNDVTRRKEESERNTILTYTDVESRIAEFEDQILTLRTERQTAQQEALEATRELNSTKERIHVLETEIQQVQREHKEISTQAEALRQGSIAQGTQNDQLTTDLATAQTTIEDLRRREQSLQTQLAAEQAELRRNQENHEIALQTQQDTFTKEQEAANLSAVELYRKLEEQINNLQTELQRVSAEKLQLERRLQTAEGNALEATRELHLTKERIHVLETEIQQVQREHKEISTQAEALRQGGSIDQGTQNDQLTTDLATAQTTIGDLKRREQSLQTQLAAEQKNHEVALQTQQGTFNKKQKAADQRAAEQYSALEQKIGTLEAELQNARKKEQELTQELNSTRGRIHALQAEIRQSAAQKGVLNRQITDYQSRIEVLEQEKNQLQINANKNTATQNKINDLKKILESAQRDIEQQRSTLKEAQARIHLLETRLVESETAHNNIATELDRLKEESSKKNRHNEALETQNADLHTIREQLEIEKKRKEQEIEEIKKQLIESEQKFTQTQESLQRESDSKISSYTRRIANLKQQLIELQQTFPRATLIELAQLKGLIEISQQMIADLKQQLQTKSSPPTPPSSGEPITEPSSREPVSPLPIIIEPSPPPKTRATQHKHELIQAIEQAEQRRQGDKRGATPKTNLQTTTRSSSHSPDELTVILHLLGYFVKLPPLGGNSVEEFTQSTLPAMIPMEQKSHSRLLLSFGIHQATTPIQPQQGKGTSLATTARWIASLQDIHAQLGIFEGGRTKAPQAERTTLLKKKIENSPEKLSKELTTQDISPLLTMYAGEYNLLKAITAEIVKFQKSDADSKYKNDEIERLNGQMDQILDAAQHSYRIIVKLYNLLVGTGAP